MVYDRGRIMLSEEEGVLIPESNTIDIDGKTFQLRYLSDEHKKSRGGNSSVFILHDPSNEEDDKAIKISNWARIGKRTPDWIKRRYGRFISEMKALREIKEYEVSNNVVSIEHDGVKEIGGLEFPFYTMEKATSDLKKYLVDDKNVLDIQEKIKLCRDIFHGIKSLHDLNYYHRDIKPDNILLFYEGAGDTGKFIWKVGDLGLIQNRERDYDDIGEKIGPFGWLSPEAMNKFLTEKAGIGLDCAINESSDVFQLGKLFWFIFKLNVPIGQLLLHDFDKDIPQHAFIFNLIFEMLQYSKDRRCKNTNVDEALTLLSLEFGI